MRYNGPVQVSPYLNSPHLTPSLPAARRSSLPPCIRESVKCCEVRVRRTEWSVSCGRLGGCFCLRASDCCFLFAEMDGERDGMGWDGMQRRNGGREERMFFRAFIGRRIFLHDLLSGVLSTSSRSIQNFACYGAQYLPADVVGYLCCCCVERLFGHPNVVVKNHRSLDWSRASFNSILFTFNALQESIIHPFTSRLRCVPLPGSCLPSPGSPPLPSSHLFPSFSSRLCLTSTMSPSEHLSVCRSILHYLHIQHWLVYPTLYPTPFHLIR
ncbi:hypothetical protein Mapa_008815 [Marchantia paleacea]|nr:hypothetical protein Mapa_008815 [Marchantia paleacea]